MSSRQQAAIPPTAIAGDGCQDGRVPFPVRTPALAALTAALFAAMALRFGVAWELPAYLYLSAVGVTLGAIDLATKRLPDAITLRSYPVFAALFLLPEVMNGEWSMYPGLVWEGPRGLGSTC